MRCSARRKVENDGESTPTVWLLSTEQRQLPVMGQDVITCQVEIRCGWLALGSRLSSSTMGFPCCLFLLAGAPVVLEPT